MVNSLKTEFQIFLFIILVVISQNALSERFKYKLEQFGLSEITSIVVSKDSNGTYYFSASDPNGYRYTVIKGDYLGLDNGKVLSINEERIIVEETYLDGSGNWTTRLVHIQPDKDLMKLQSDLEKYNK